jgi:glycosyltransferase involved in cell wall biosynthesis
MALKVRDEGDVIESNLRYHHALGVDHFIVTDNGSTDETPEILARYADAGLADVIEAPGTDYREQGAAWLTRMARLAATEHGADWVIHTDADEFWLPISGSLKDVLGAIPSRYGVVVAPRTEFVGRPDAPGTFAERLTVREARSRLHPKVAHRAETDVVSLDRGAHDVAAEGPSGDVAENLRPPGRPVHRTVRDLEEGDGARDTDDARLVWAPTWPLRILHFPVRSFEQFKRRTEIAIFEGRFPDWGRFKRLRELYEAGRFEEIFSDLVLDDIDVEEGIREGRLVMDERLANLLPRCPDPRNGIEAGTVRVELGPQEAERERSDLELDAMQLLGRTQRWTTIQRDRNRLRIEELRAESRRHARQRDRARERVARLRDRVESKNALLARRVERVKRLRRRLRAERRRLRAERRRPWSRLRRAAGRLLGRGGARRGGDGRADGAG